ncbi:MAG: DEAD/DEAH box helicase [Lachnospiraceae bacterium]|nr:DEAD/DEAH box helicase [Lachnospiraceae bacterium]
MAGRSSIMLSAVNNLEYYNGLSLSKTGAYHVVNVSSFWKDEITVIGATSETTDTGEASFIKITYHPNSERYMQNSCSRCHASGHLCRHGVAIAILWSATALTDETRVSKSADPEDPVITSLIETYSEMEWEEEELHEKVSLLPQIIRNDDPRYPYAVEYKIGTQRPYVLKNLSEFAEHIRNRDTVSYGKQLTFRHSREAFAENSLAQLDFILRTDEARHFLLNRYETPKGLHHIPLTENNTSAFLRSLDPAQIVVADSELPHLMPVIASNPDISCKIGKIHDDHIKVSLEGHLGLISAGYELALILDNRIYLCDPDFSAKAGSFLAGFMEGRNGRRQSDIFRVIHKDRFGEFYAKVLHPISSVIRIEAAEDIDLANYNPITPDISFYLDVPEEGSAGLLTLRVKISYEDVPVELGVASENEDRLPAYRRNLSLERKIRARIRSYFENDIAQKDLFRLETEDKLYEFYYEGMEFLYRFGTVYASEDVKQIRVRPKSKIQVGVSLNGNLLDLKIEDTDGLTLKELAALLDQYRKKKKYYRLKDGSFFSLENDTQVLDEADRLFRELHVSTRSLGEKRNDTLTLPVNRIFYLEQLARSLEDASVTIDAQAQAFSDKFMRGEEDMPKVPDSLRSVLRDYQIQGFYWLKKLQKYGFGGILADEMGLGKTVQLLSLLLSEKEEGRACHTLIVCPASLIFNWYNEIRKFTPSLRSVMVIGSAAERASILEEHSDHDILITSYDLLRRDYELYGSIEFAFEILDEAQYIKNQQTKNALAVRAIHSVTRYALTGTPIENRLSELWSIFSFLMPGYLYDYSEFRERVEIPIVKDEDAKAADKLRTMIAPFILRRRKKDVLPELPDKLEETVYVRLEGEQRKLYDARTAQLLEQLSGQSDEAYAQNKIEILSQLLRLRQICCSPDLVYEDYKGANAKLDACMEYIQQALEGGHKMLIFSQFTSMLEIIAERLKSENWGFYRITGDTPKQERAELVEKFQDETQNDTRIFLISLKAGGTGLNLTAADIVIHYDPWWNLSVQNQATDRTHRIGQQNVVSVFRLITENTIEENILKLQQAKGDLAERILDTEKASFGNLTREELLELLR